MKADGSDHKAQAPATTPAVRKNPLKDLINSDYVKARFSEVMGERGPAFLASVLNATRTNPALLNCDPNSVLSAAMAAAALDLPIDSNLGFSAIVPYNGKRGMVAQFQIMTKGFVQLALRSGQYKTINVSPIYEDELRGYDIITGDVQIEPVADGYRAHDEQSKIVGYAAFFRLLNGFERIDYWPVKRIVAHGKRFSKSFNKDTSLWKTDPHAMYQKTVLKNTLSKWGILSVSMQIAMKTDQAVIHDFGKPVDDDENIEYADSGEAEAEEKPAALPGNQQAEAAPAQAAPGKKPEPVPVASNGDGEEPPEAFQEGPGLF